MTLRNELNSVDGDTAGYRVVNEAGPAQFSAADSLIATCDWRRRLPAIGVIDLCEGPPFPPKEEPVLARLDLTPNAPRTASTRARCSRRNASP
jgi:hypothetical protein